MFVILHLKQVFVTHSIHILNLKYDLLFSTTWINNVDYIFLLYSNTTWRHFWQKAPTGTSSVGIVCIIYLTMTTIADCIKQQDRIRLINSKRLFFFVSLKVWFIHLILRYCRIMTKSILYHSCQKWLQPWIIFDLGFLSGGIK